MAFKMPQKFPTASLDITEDFHILHSAYVYICYSILKAKTYNWLPHTHTQQQQLQTKSNWACHIAANGHLTGSDALFMCKILTASSN